MPQNSSSKAMDVQAFCTALERAVAANDECEAARLVCEHTAALDAYLTRMMARLESGIPCPSDRLH
jgi:hypothetical protein